MRGSILPPHRIKPTLRPAKRCRLGQHRGEPGGARPFRHGLLQGQEGIDGALDQRLVDQDNVADQFAHDGQRQLAGIAATAMPSASVAPPHGRSAPWIAFHIDG